MKTSHFVLYGALAYAITLLCLPPPRRACACVTSHDLFKIERCGEPMITTGINYPYRAVQRTVRAMKYEQHQWKDANDASFTSSEQPYKISAAQTMCLYAHGASNVAVHGAITLYVKGTWNGYYDDDTLVDTW